MLADCSASEDLQKAICKAAVGLAHYVKTEVAGENFHRLRQQYWAFGLVTKPWHDLQCLVSLQGRSSFVVATYKVLETLRTKMKGAEAEGDCAATFVCSQVACHFIHVRFVKSWQYTSQDV